MLVLYNSQTFICSSRAYSSAVSDERVLAPRRLGTQMIIEQMSIAVPHGKKQQLGSALASFVGPTRVQPGCLSCSLAQGWTDPDELRFESRWENEDDLIRHLKSDSYRQLLQLMELSSTPPQIEFFDVVKAQGLDLVYNVRSAPI